MAAHLERWVGGAGTGKTTALLKVMAGAKDRLGGSPFAIGFTSFTRAARAEAVTRASQAWNIDEKTLEKDGWFRTVHSIAHKQLEIQSGELIDQSKESAQWVAEALGVSVRAVYDDDTGQCSYSGDQAAASALNAWKLSRDRMEPLGATVLRMARIGAAVPSLATCEHFVGRYESAKYRDGRFDFCDLLARFGGVAFDKKGYREVEPEGDLPEGVKAWVMDEHQDASALIDRCCRRLADGPSVQKVWIAGDPMQSIFSFGGSDSRHFMRWDVDVERTMPKTWRCPKPVHALGEKCLRLMRNGYWDRKIAHADHDGEVIRTSNMERVLSSLTPDQDTLILARCNYMCEDIQATLANNRIPFSKLKSRGSEGLMKAVNALWDLEHGEPVAPEDFAAAVDLLPALGNMRRGAKAEWGREETWKRWTVVLPEDLQDAGFKEEFAKKILAGDWGRLFTGAERWRAAAERHGPEVATRPAVRVGTIHAAKGLEADNVILSTSVTRKIFECQNADQETHDEERRVEYVGVTRARKSLTVVHDAAADYRMRIPV